MQDTCTGGDISLRNCNRKKLSTIEDIERNSNELYLCDVCSFLCEDKIQFTNHLEGAHRQDSRGIILNEDRSDVSEKHTNVKRNSSKEEVSKETEYVDEEILANGETHENNIANTEETNIISEEVHLEKEYENSSQEETEFLTEQRSNENLLLINEHSNAIPTEIFLKTEITESETEDSHHIVLIPDSALSNSTDDQMYVLVDTPESQHILLEHKSEETVHNNSDKLKKVRNTEKMHFCEICQKVFNRFSNLTAHLTSHTKDFACYVCCNSYSSQFRLDQHMTQHSEENLIHLKDSPAMVQCQCNSQCNKVFYSKFALYEHKKQHQNIVEYSCDGCDKKFLTYRQLITHKKRHGENAVCTVCGKVYSSDKILLQHLRLHSGEKPYECTVCKMKFRFQSGLSVHEKIHTGERNYKCGQCSKTFARSNYLKEHIRIHFNEKPFRCEFCEATFTQKNVLKTHVSKKHRHCPVCQKHVGDALQLRMHIWKTHPEAHGMLGLDENETITETITDSVLM